MLFRSGWEPEISLAVEVLFPTWLVLDALAAFAKEAPDTHIELVESVISGTMEALLSGRAKLGIADSIPPGFSGEPLIRLRMIIAASPHHPLHHLKRKATLKDLRAYRQLVVRETGQSRATRTSVQATQRWTVSNMSTSIIAARAGYGYAWYPEYKIRDELAAGMLKPVPLREGGERFVEHLPDRLRQLLGQRLGNWLQCPHPQRLLGRVSQRHHCPNFAARKSLHHRQQVFV